MRTCSGEDLSLTAKGGNRGKCQLDIKIWVKENLFVLNSEQESQVAITHPFRKMRERDGAQASDIFLSILGSLWTLRNAH